MKTSLRSGYTTGACAAAAAKGAVELLLTGRKSTSVTILLPDQSRVSFSLEQAELRDNAATAAVIKDGGDDPDVTHGAQIVATCILIPANADAGQQPPVEIIGGTGVGRITKPGLAVEVGQPAINPVPRQMIEQAVLEALSSHGAPEHVRCRVTISVPQGEVLAQKTLNKRLGILGGISILGTTGIVRPISADAWTATIAASMDVAEAAGIEEIMLCTGRTSERCLETLLAPAEEALVMMGDYLEFSLKEIRGRTFTHVHMAAMWAKLLKGAMRLPHTHVRYKILEIDDIITFLRSLGSDETTLDLLKDAHTAREILSRLLERGDWSIIKRVCEAARIHYASIAGRAVTIYLVDGSGSLLCTWPEQHGK